VKEKGGRGGYRWNCYGLSIRHTQEAGLAGYAGFSLKLVLARVFTPSSCYAGSNVKRARTCNGLCICANE